MSSTSSIPAFYRIWFTIIDPLMRVGSAYGFVFQPYYMLSQFTPSPLMPIPIETRMMTDQSAGFYLCLAILFGYLLRARPNDMAVWLAVQGGTLVIDFAVLSSFARALVDSERLNISAWSQGELGSIIVTALVAVIRLAFLAGFGFGAKEKDVKKKS